MNPILRDEPGDEIVSLLRGGDDETPRASPRGQRAALTAETRSHLDPERLEHPSQLRRSLLAERHERQDHQRHRRAAVAAAGD